jgi:hypothetical protein
MARPSIVNPFLDFLDDFVIPLFPGIDQSVLLGHCLLVLVGVIEDILESLRLHVPYGWEIFPGAVLGVNGKNGL